MSHLGNRGQGVHGRPRYAKLSIHDGSKEKIASVHSDFECGLWALSLMGFGLLGFKLTIDLPNGHGTLGSGTVVRTRLPRRIP